MMTDLRCNSSKQRPYRELGWESLQNRRNKHKLTLFYKICNKCIISFVFLLNVKNVKINGWKCAILFFRNVRVDQKMKFHSFMVDNVYKI